MRAEVHVVGEYLDLEVRLGCITADGGAEDVGDMFSVTELGHGLVAESDAETSLEDELTSMRLLRSR